MIIVLLLLPPLLVRIGHWTSDLVLLGPFYYLMADPENFVTDKQALCLSYIDIKPKTEHK